MLHKVSNLTELKGWELKELLDSITYGHLDLPLEIYHAELEEVLGEMNRRGKLIAKKYKKRFYPFELRDFSKRYYEKKG